MPKYLLLIFVVILSCTESKVSKSTKAAAPDNSSEPRSAEYFSGDIQAKQKVEFTYSGLNFFSQTVSSGYTFEIKNVPSTVTIDSSTGLITGTYDTPGEYKNIYVKATATSDSSTINSDEFTIAVNGDPLRAHAWHLKNTGQSTFSSVRATSGYDINVEDVWADGITGKGVKVAISDTGVEYKHDDLYDNHLSGEHRNYSIGSPYIGEPTPVDFHGTAVTGITSAVAYNNFGSLGVAPGSKFAGFLFISQNIGQTVSQIVHQAQGDFDIFNYSYGDYSPEDRKSDATYLAQLEYQTQTLDKVFVKAAGNEYFLVDTDFPGVCVSHNANVPFENESPHMIIVGALTGDGTKSSYSSAGSNLWVSAPGGEDGESLGPAILTTDLKTCFKGFSIAGTTSSNKFEYNHLLNLQCDYTASMNGTSSATPIVSGVIALMREVNPSLKMRDIKHILAKTSVQVDPNFNLNYFGTDHPSELSSVSSICTTDLTLSGHSYEQGWVENKATTGPGSTNGGFVFSNFYGFGMVDAKAAVALAKTYTDYLPTQQSASVSTGTVSLAIPDADATGVSQSLTISSSLTVESVRLNVQVSHSKSGQIGVEVTSPSGTKSILLNINNSFLLSTDADLNIDLTSNAFYGEPSNGSWSVKVIDGLSGTSGFVTSLSLEVLGH